jgi:hypothetical protein
VEGGLCASKKKKACRGTAKGLFGEVTKRRALIALSLFPGGRYRATSYQHVWAVALVNRECGDSFDRVQPREPAPARTRRQKFKSEKPQRETTRKGKGRHAKQRVREDGEDDGRGKKFAADGVGGRDGVGGGGVPAARAAGAGGGLYKLQLTKRPVSICVLN